MEVEGSGLIVDGLLFSFDCLGMLIPVYYLKWLTVKRCTKLNKAAKPKVKKLNLYGLAAIKLKT